MRYKRMLNSKKAISPIFATLILIAIAVIAGVVVYMFTSGVLSTMTAGGVAGTEKITVQGSAIATETGSKIQVYIEQTGGPAATVNGLIIKDSGGNVDGVIPSSDFSYSPALGASGTLATGTMYVISVTIGTGTGDYSIPSAVVAGNSYSLTVTTQAGGSFVSPSAVAT